MQGPENINKSNLEAEDIVASAAAGNAEAFGRIYDIYADRIYRHIYFRTGKTEDARDLTHDVFIKAWQALPGYKRTRTPFIGWLYTICRHTVIDYYRTRKNHGHLSQEIVLEDPGKRPEELAETQNTREEIRKAIMKLSYDQQQAILMSFIEGFEYHEIAAILNKSEGNIRVIIHRALKKMREILGGAD